MFANVKSTGLGHKKSFFPSGGCIHNVSDCLKFKLASLLAELIAITEYVDHNLSIGLLAVDLIMNGIFFACLGI